jgi:hypothetical protein
MFGTRPRPPAATELGEAGFCKIDFPLEYLPIFGGPMRFWALTSLHQSN